MSDMTDVFESMREGKKDLRRMFGVECPQCKKLRPKTNASILLPGQRCRVDSYVDPRPALTDADYQAAYGQAEGGAE